MGNFRRDWEKNAKLPEPEMCPVYLITPGNSEVAQSN